MFWLRSTAAHRAIWVTLGLFLAVACGKKSDNRNPTSVPETITDIQTLANASDRGALVGKKVEIAGAPAGRVVGTYVFWAGEPGVPGVQRSTDRGL